jgi:hypothetical protein
MAGGSKDEIILEHARAAAQADSISHALLRQVKVAFIERGRARGPRCPEGFWFIGRGNPVPQIDFVGQSAPQRVDPSATMPPQEPERTADIRPCEGHYRSWLNWIDTNPELSVDATGRSGRSRRAIRDFRSGNDEAPNTEDQLAQGSQFGSGVILS